MVEKPTKKQLAALVKQLNRRQQFLPVLEELRQKRLRELGNDDSEADESFQRKFARLEMTIEKAADEIERLRLGSNCISTGTFQRQAPNASFSDTSEGFHSVPFETFVSRRLSWDTLAVVDQNDSEASVPPQLYQHLDQE